MDAHRPNIVLLVVAVLSLAFGIYGFLFGGVANAPAPTPAGSNTPQLSDTEDPRHNSPRSRNRRVPDPNTPAGTEAESTPEDTTAKVDPPAPEPEVQPPKRGDGVIEGTIADPQGLPLAGIRVTAIEDKYVPRRGDSADFLKLEVDRLKRDSFFDVSDEAGQFKLEGLSQSESYRLTVVHELWGELTRNGMAGQRLYLQFQDVLISSGTVVDEAGNPVSGAELAWTWGDGAFYEATPQEAGRFLAYWEEGYVAFRIQCPGYQPGETFDETYQGRTDMVVVLRKAPQLEVSVISPAGEPVPLTEVRITAARNPAGEEVPLNTLMEENWRRTDMRGRVLFRSLPPGSYEISCSIREGGARADASVTLNADMLVKLTVDPGLSLTVRVLSATGKPVAGAYLSLRDDGGERLDALQLDTGEPGEIRFFGLPAALLQVRVSATGFPRHWFEVDLTGGSQTLEATLKPGGKLKGKVTDSGGTGLQGVLLKLIAPGGAEKDFMETTSTDRAGVYKTELLLPGTWTVELYRDWMGERLAVATVTIAEGDNTQDFMLDSICVVKVVIEYDEGMSGDWCRLWIQEQGDTEPTQDWISRDENNEKRLSLRAGTYSISASTDRLSSPTRDVEAVPGETVVRLRMAGPTALRFSWIESGSELSKAGIKTGDMLIEYNGQPVTSKAELNRLVELAAELNEVEAVVMRGKTRVEVKMPKLAFHYWLEPAAR